MLISCKKCYKGFTLAEMMVVMLILTIILAAFAPLMTKRKVVDLTNPWRYASNNSDIYYGLAGQQSAMIGQSEKGTNDKGRLIINSSSTTHPHIMFKKDNSVQGYLSLFNRNVVFGNKILSESVTDNVLIGDNVSSVGEGSYNVAVGSQALRYGTTPQKNTAVGYMALYGGHGELNTALGYQALTGTIPTSKYNVAVGPYACKNVTGSNKTCIGANSGPVTGSSTATDSSNIVYIGTSDSTVYIPGNLIVGKQTYLGPSLSNFAAVWLRTWQETGYLGVDVNGDTRHALHFTNVESGNDDPHAGGYPSWVGTIISDKRLKNVGKPNIDGLDKINTLKVYNYTLKNDTAKTPRVGVIAQDLQKIFPNAVKKGKDGYLSIRQEDMFYAMVNAVQQLDTLVQGLISEVKTALFKISAHDKEIQALQKENTELKIRIEKLEKLLY